MEKAQKRHLSASQLLEVYMKKRSKAYQSEGYKYARNISNQFFVERLFAFALDTCVMFLPIALWLLLLLMTFGNMLPYGLFSIIQIITFGLLVVSIFGFNAYLSSKSGGQTLGKYIYDLKVVGKNHKEVSSKKLIMREVIGFGLPSFVLLLFTNVFGIIIYWIIDFLFSLFHPSHVSIVDACMGLRIVILHDDDAVVKTVPVQNEATVPKEKSSPKVALGTIDLHMHSNFSDDGQFNVEELFQMAAKNGLKTISVCDHNSVKANLIAKRMSSLYHIEHIPGVEFDCRYGNYDLRILGYFIDYSNDIFAHLENEALKREKMASIRRVERFEEFTHLKVDVDALMEKNRFQKITPSMIIYQVLNNASYAEEPILQPYLMEEDQTKAIRKMAQDFYGIGGPCFVSVRYPKLEDVLEIIHLSGGVAVMSWSKKILDYGDTYFDEVLTKGIDGIEVFTPYYESRDMARLLKKAKDAKVFVTCGSDFHGERHPGIVIGQTGCPKDAESIIKDFIDSHI